MTKTDRILQALAEAGAPILLDDLHGAIDEPPEEEPRVKALARNLAARGLLVIEEGEVALSQLGRQLMADSPPGSDDEPAPTARVKKAREVVTDLDGIPVGPRPRRRALAGVAEFVANHRADPLRAAKIDRAHQQNSAAREALQLAISDEGEVLIIEEQRVIYALSADIARRVAQLIQRVSA